MPARYARHFKTMISLPFSTPFLFIQLKISRVCVLCYIQEAIKNSLLDVWTLFSTLVLQFSFLTESNRSAADFEENFTLLKKSRISNPSKFNVYRKKMPREWSKSVSCELFRVSHRYHVLKTKGNRFFLFLEESYVHSCRFWARILEKNVTLRNDLYARKLMVWR